MAAHTVKRVTEPCKLMEGPHWDQKKKRIYYVDIFEQKMLSYHTDTQQVYSAYIKNGPVGVIVPVENQPNKFVVGSGRDFLLVTWDGESNVADLPYEKLASVESDRTDTRFNDGKCDSAGRIWLGTMGSEKGTEFDLNRGTLYSVESDLKPKVQVSPVNISNGIDWSLQDDVMYYIDSLTYQVWAYDFDQNTGTITNKRVIFDLKKNKLQGIPDGMTIDTNGNLWVATFNGSKVLNIDPKTGTLLRTIEMPAQNVTSVAFGGPNLNILYVTTANHQLTEDQRKAQPDAGCLFAVENLGVTGRLPNNFKLNQ